MLHIITSKKESSQESISLLDEIAREGARKMLASALEFEANLYVEQHHGSRDERNRALVVRNGYGKERGVTFGSGTVKINAPRIKDRREGEKFVSNILPPYLRRTPKVETLLPLLYLKGLSGLDMEPALREFLGDGATLSPSTITNLKKKWEEEFSAWKKEKITEEFAYIWVDGVNLRIRLGEDNKICLLVVIGVNAKGEKKLLAAEAGYRESKDSWAAVLRDLRDRGFKAPLVAVGDGALGFWGALRAVDGFAKTKEQRCWVHKIANVLDKLPKRLQPRAKGMLHEMMRAESRAAAGKIKIKFAEEFHAKYASAVDCLEKDWAELTVYFDFPAEHWKHLRTTNPIESTFATVRLRTTITKGAGSATAAKTMAFKLLQEAEKRWNKINGVKQIENILQGIAYKDGVMVPTKSSQETPAA